MTSLRDPFVCPWERLPQSPALSCDRDLLHCLIACFPRLKKAKMGKYGHHVQQQRCSCIDLQTIVNGLFLDNFLSFWVKTESGRLWQLHGSSSWILRLIYHGGQSLPLLGWNHLQNWAVNPQNCCSNPNCLRCAFGWGLVPILLFALRWSWIWLWKCGFE